MEIDTKRSVIRIQLRRFVVLIVFLIIILACMLLGNLENLFLGLNKYHWALLAAIIYIGIAVFESLLQFNYVYFSDEGERIILRYFSLAFLNKKKNSVEIPKKAFSNYTLVKSFGGLAYKLILFQRIKDKEAKYPPIFITVLKKSERENLLKTLDKYK